MYQSASESGISIYIHKLWSNPSINLPRQQPVNVQPSARAFLTPICTRLNHEPDTTLSIPQLTPDDRLWRIDWFGECHYPSGRRKSQPSIRVVISPVLCHPKDFNAMLSATATSLNNQRQVWLPVGILYLVRIGDIWRSGQCVHAPDYQVQKFEKLEINKGTTDFIKAGLALDGEFLLPLNEHPWHRLQTQSYCLSVTLLNKKRIVIPCVELIRFYFGSASKLLHLLFTRQISAEDFWKSKHFDKSSRRLHLKLASGLSGMSATDIGRIALDNDAWRAARLIFDTCLAASVRREPIYPYTGFPFIGETNLVASGKWISCGATTDATFVVYTIQSCSHSFPFESLTYEVEDFKKVFSKKNNSTNHSQESQGQTSFTNSFRTKSQALADTDPGKSRYSKEYWAKGSPRFPYLTKKLVWRERYDTNDPPVVLFLKGAAQDEQISVGDGSSSNGETRGIDIGQGPAPTDLSAIDPKQHKFVHEGIELAIKQANLHAKSVTPELIALSGYSHPVISLPHLVDENGEINSVSFCSDEHGGQRLRRGCFVVIKEAKKTHFKVFIVERMDAEDKVKAIIVRNFNLKRAMESLIEKSGVGVQ